MLSQFVSVYVPSKSPTGPIPRKDHTRAVRRIAAEFSKVLGGATAYPARGYWNSESTGLTEESITIVRAYYTPENAAAALQTCNDLAAGLKAEFAQEAVTIETESGIEFI